MLNQVQRNIITRAALIRKEAGEDPAEVLERYSRLTDEERAEILEIVTEE